MAKNGPILNLWQLDEQLCLVHQASSGPTKGRLQVVVAPTITAPTGEVLQWVTTLHPVLDNPTFGTEGTGSWTTTPDYRKVPLFLTADGSAYTLDSTVNDEVYNGLGKLPAWLTDTVRPSNLHTWQSGAWAEDLELVQAAQKSLLSSACAAQIVAGFTSSSLGSPYTYPSTMLDQQNLAQTAANSTGGSLMCAKSGTWSLKAHTQAQAQQVLEDFIVARDTPRAKLRTLSDEIDATTTVAAVHAIVW